MCHELNTREKMGHEQATHERHVNMRRGVYYRGRVLTKNETRDVVSVPRSQCLSICVYVCVCVCASETVCLFVSENL